MTTFLSSGWNAQHAETPSKLKSMLLWLCGMELNSEKEQPPTPPPEAVVSSLEEEPYLRHVVNANLIVCLSVTVFLFAFWA